MAREATTLRKLLSQRKPDIPCLTTATKNTTKCSWPDLHKKNITIWKEFNLDTLNASYSHVLDLPVSDPLSGVPSINQTFEGLTVNSDLDVNNLIGWNAMMMKATFDFARSRIGLKQGSPSSHAYSTPNKSTLAKIPGYSPRLQVDHVISLSCNLPQNLVVGLGRTSKKWRGVDLTCALDQGRKPTREQTWPLRQLLAICDIANTRYGYIQTDKEFVVCRFNKNAAEEWKVAIASIPVGNFGEGVLTADLALWWLCMLAASSKRNSEIVAEEEMVEIDQWAWDEFQGSMVHKYSNYSAPELFQMPPFEAQGNPANPVFGVNPADLAFGANPPRPEHQGMANPIDHDVVQYLTNPDNDQT
ncbi:unnamed protein product [Clonostachys rhizophaga]|uniref:Uncharacterized protein n=1 Tax=Clonostachys rhizophaga TaxID=160324 RepID=A0A9N9V5N5_9HYPO|nr:unnamed protein product [Clonostachys rhizophaga]